MSFGDLKIFVITFEISLPKSKIPFVDFVKTIEPNESIIGINSNFGHKSHPKHTDLIKKPNPSKKQLQGDNTCFNSAIDIVVLTHNPDIKERYKLKYFPSTGKTQLSGVADLGFTDALFVINIFYKYLIESGVIDDPDIPVANFLHYSILINVKTMIITDQRIDLNELVKCLKNYKIKNSDSNITTITKSAIGDRVMFKCVEPCEEKKKKLNILNISVFKSGKINILGSRKYEFITNAFETLKKVVGSAGPELFKNKLLVN